MLVFFLFTMGFITAAYLYCGEHTDRDKLGFILFWIIMVWLYNHPHFCLLCN